MHSGLRCILSLTLCLVSGALPAAMPVAPPLSALAPLPADVARPLRIGVALYVDNLRQLDEIAHTYQGEIELRFRWRDPSLRFDARAAGTDRREYLDEDAKARLSMIWNPQIRINNLIEAGSRITPGLIIHADGTVELVQRIKGSFEANLKLNAFPFDRQNLPVVMLSSRYDSKRVNLVQEPIDLASSGLAPTLRLKGWKVGNLYFETTHVRSWNGTSVPQITALLRIGRHSSSILMAVFVPFLLLILVPTVLTYAAEADLASRLSAWATSILALVALSFTFALRYHSLEAGNLVSRMITSGFIYQFASVLIVVTLYNPAVIGRFGDPFIVREVQVWLKWAMPLGLIGLLIFQASVLANHW